MFRWTTSDAPGPVEGLMSREPAALPGLLQIIVDILHADDGIVETVSSR
jgi:hypothetical protein